MQNSKPPVIEETKSHASNVSTVIDQSDSELVHSIPPEQKTHIEESQSNDDMNKMQKGFPQLAYFGQMHGTYLFAQSEEGEKTFAAELAFACLLWSSFIVK